MDKCEYMYFSVLVVCTNQDISRKMWLDDYCQVFGTIDCHGIELFEISF